MAERVDPAACPAPRLRQEGLGGGREALQLTCLRTRGDLEVLPPRLGPSGPGGHHQRGRGGPGRCRVTSCEAAPSRASVSLSVGGGCQLADLTVYDKLSSKATTPLRSDTPSPPGPRLPVPLVAIETSVLWSAKA